MLSKPPEQLPALLFVDDEVKTCRHFQRLFSHLFRIHLAHDGLEAMELFRKHHEDIGIIMTDQCMPNETGTEFLQKAADLKPSVKRILSTAYADVDSAIDAVNNGGIYRYITKPWEVSELEVTLMRAMELYLIETERASLLSNTNTNVEKVAATERIHGLAALSVFKESGLRRVSSAIGTLVHLGQPDLDASAANPEWKEAYQNHRQFLKLAHAALPDNLAPQSDLNPQDIVSAHEILAFSNQEIPELPIQSGNSQGSRFPGPLDSVGPLFVDLIKSLIAPLKGPSEASLHGASDGLELRIPASPLKQSLSPLFGSQETSIQNSQPCLNLLTSLLHWHHHGGTVEVSQDANQGALRLQLGYEKPVSGNDPWQHLALDLVANESFWSRQI